MRHAPYGRRVTGHAGRGGGKECAIGKMARDTANDSAIDAALGDGDARRDRNLEG